MNEWHEFNAAIKSIYCNAEGDSGSIINRLVGLAMKSDDSTFIQAVLVLKENVSKVDKQLRFLWLTSTIDSRFYPPIPISEASPVSWNKTEYCAPGTEELQRRYPGRAKLQNEEDYSGGIEQCRDVPDCSLVASLINLRSKNLNLPLIKQISSTKYHVNLSFNGSNKRLVTVDISQIPTSVDGKQLSLKSNDISDKIGELALLLVSKGTYSADGSNISIDTYRLSGFLPEITQVNSYPFEKLWKFHKSNLCLMGAGTGNRSNDMIKPLVENHDYSIIDITYDSRLVKLRDPRNSALNVEISYEQYLKNFKQLYLNWNQEKLFKRSQVLHFRYDTSRYNKFSIVADKPLFHLVNNSKVTETVWLLLESHLQNEGSQENRSVSFLNEAPECIICPIEPPVECGGNRIGLQLVKLRLDAETERLLYCYSTTNNNFKGKASFDTCNFFQNPTFELEVHSEQDYQVLMDAASSMEFELLASIRLSSSWRLISGITLRSVNLIYGTYPYHCRNRFHWKETSDKLKIQMTLPTKKYSTNKLFIRVVPVESSARLRIRCNIFEPESALCVYECQEYRTCPSGGIVIPDLEVSRINIVVLMIERSVPISSCLPTEGQLDELELFVGSSQKIRIEKYSDDVIPK
ncbi:Calpain-like protease 1 [Saccharomyces cerevisiae]|nr:Calpain-like protease 1 [Saccharomyces cerevisiae]